MDYSNYLYEIDDEKELVQEDNSHLEKNVFGDEKDELWDEPKNKEDELKVEKAKMQLNSYLIVFLHRCNEQN